MDAIKELDTVKVGVPLMGDLILIRSKGWMAEINCGVQTRFSDVGGICYTFITQERCDRRYI